MESVFFLRPIFFFAPHFFLRPPFFFAPHFFPHSLFFLASLIHVASSQFCNLRTTSDRAHARLAALPQSPPLPPTRWARTDQVARRRARRRRLAGLHKSARSWRTTVFRRLHCSRCCTQNLPTQVHRRGRSNLAGAADPCLMHSSLTVSLHTHTFLTSARASLMGMQHPQLRRLLPQLRRLLQLRPTSCPTRSSSTST